MPTECFMLEPTGRIRRSLRRYRSSGEWTCEGRYHNAVVPLDEHDLGEGEQRTSGDLWPHDDPRWPETCEKCDYRFTEDDAWQLHVEGLWRRSDTGELTTIRDAPGGAMWFADWMEVDRWRGPDGRTLMVKLPNGREWMVDGQANNCTLPDDVGHRCWVRTGTPPRVTAGKDGHTCSAGAGSILAGDYHGFLRDGVLT